MASKQLDSKKLSLVFQTRPDIVAAIQQQADTPACVSLFNEIAMFVYNQLSAGDESALKRRRIDVPEIIGTELQNGAQGANSADVSAAGEHVQLELKDISVAAPQRKKYDLCFTQNYLYARASGSSTPVPGIVYAWRSIEHIFYLPVPEKPRVQHNYVLLPQNSYLPTKTPTKTGTPAPTPEPLVFTIPSGTAPKPTTIAGLLASSAAAVSDKYESLITWALERSLSAAGNTATRIVRSDPRVFKSVARQVYQSSEPGVHVRAFRGSKDGFLFFLETGVLWGFKKPLVFLPVEKMAAVSYTSVLQRTFNVAIELDMSAEQQDGGFDSEIEFGMVDQEDYQGIDGYVKSHGLANRSMAEARKAKKELIENGERGAQVQMGGGAKNGEGGADGASELMRARQEAELQLQDMERDDDDDEEEDYDPGSEGQSEGEGQSSEEDGEGEIDDDDDDEEDANLSHSA